MDSNEIILKLQSFSELTKFINQMPLDKSDKTRLLEKMDLEMRCVEYNIVKDLGEIELKKIKNKIGV